MFGQHYHSTVHSSFTSLIHTRLCPLSPTHVVLLLHCCRTFEVEVEYFGTTRKEELKPGGASIPVTAANREEYVHLYTRWLLTTSVEQQFTAFAHGFHQVCGALQACDAGVGAT